MTPSREAVGDLERLLGELGERNRDNVTRTASYLELYAWTREHGPDLPWLLMAHLVSRNGGYNMTDVAAGLGRDDGPFGHEAQLEMFGMLERANFLIFHDAWHHVLMALMGRSASLGPPRTPVYVCGAWARYEGARAAACGVVTPAAERQLVRDLVTNEQNLIERRVVRAPRFAKALAVIGFVESMGRERPLVLPCTDAKITVGGFGSLDRRIAAGWRIFDEVLADREGREAMFRWAMDHPHTGSRAVYGGRPTPTVREAWPPERVRSLGMPLHWPPEDDPLW